MSNFNLYFDIPEGSNEYLIPLFSVPLFHLKLNDWESKKNALLEIYEERRSNPDVFKICCEKESSHDVETDYHYNYDNETGYNEQITEILREELEIFSDTFNCAVEVCNTWFERARTGKMHQVHNHGVSGFSCVLFVEFDPKYHTPTVFLNPNLADVESTNSIPPGIREGSLLFFPSYVLHYTAPNESDVDRIILSFNIATEYENIKFEDEKNEPPGEYYTKDV